MPFTGQAASGIVGIVALAPALGHDPKVLIERTVLAFIVEDVLVDGFMADGEVAVHTDGIRYLART